MRKKDVPVTPGATDDDRQLKEQDHGRHCQLEAPPISQTQEGGDSERGESDVLSDDADDGPGLAAHAPGDLHPIVEDGGAHLCHRRRPGALILVEERAPVTHGGDRGGLQVETSCVSDDIVGASLDDADGESASRRS